MSYARSHVQRFVMFAAVAALLAPTTARADRHVSRGRRAAAVAAAIVPGFLVHGAGNFVLHRRRTAKHLFYAGTLGEAAMIAGGLPVGIAGGSPYTMPGVPVLLAGAGLSLPMWFADIASSAGADQTGRPLAPAPYSLELGTTYQHAAYHDRAFAGAAATVALGPLTLGAGELLGAEGDAHIEDVSASWRFYGAASTGRIVRRGDRLALTIAGRHRRDDDDRVTAWTGEVTVSGRVDLSHLDPVLAGQFLEASTGLGGERVEFARDEHDTTSLLLGGFAYGLYLGRGSEVSVYYDHRRDGLAGGIAAWRGAGFVGSVGARALVRIAPHWRIHGQLDIGNAWVTTLGLRYEGSK